MAKLIGFVLFAIVIGVVICEDCDYKGLVIKKGEQGHPKGECISVYCEDAGKISAVPCPQIGIPHGCKVKYEGIDLTKTYPDCCGKAYCEDKN